MIPVYMHFQVCIPLTAINSRSEAYLKNLPVIAFFPAAPKIPIVVLFPCSIIFHTILLAGNKIKYS